MYALLLTGSSQTVSLSKVFNLDDVINPCHQDPVFFAAHCEKRADLLPSRTAYGFNGDDIIVRSVGAAVDFAKVNNLLGIFVDAELLVSYRRIFLIQATLIDVFADASTVIDSWHQKRRPSCRCSWGFR